MSNDPNDEYWLRKVKEAYLDEIGDLQSVYFKTEQELRRIAEWIAKKINASYQRVLEALRRLGGGSFD